MSAMVRHEFYKLHISRPYKILLLSLLLFAVYAAVLAGVTYVDWQRLLPTLVNTDAAGNYLEDVNAGQVLLYNQWIGGRSGSDFFATVFYFFLPLIVCVPQGLSFSQERKSGYVRNLVSRKGKFKYFAAKYLVTFYSGFSLVFFALLTNILVVAAFIPAHSPDPFEWLANAIYPAQPFSSLFYTHPVLYMLIYVLLESVFSGLLVTVSMVLSFYVKNGYTALFGPFLFLLFFRNLMDLLLHGRSNLETSPFSLFRAALSGGTSTYEMMAAYIFGLLFLTTAFTIWKAKTHDIF